MGIESRVKTQEETVTQEKTVMYKKRKFNKKHFSIIVAILIGLYLLAMVFVWIGTITSVVDLEYFEGTSKYIGKYIEGDVTCRTKALPAMEDGWEKKDWYYFMIPYGKEGKYILVYADQKQYKQFINLPETNPSKGQKQENKTVVPLTGKIIKISGPIYEDFQEMLGITVEENTTDDKEKANTEEEKSNEVEKQELEQEQSIEEITNIEIAIKLTDYRKEQTEKFWIVTIIWLIVVMGVMYKMRKWILEVKMQEPVHANH